MLGRVRSKMEKFIKINTSPYKEINSIRVSTKYEKDKGYAIVIEFVTRKDNLFSKSFCPEYYKLGDLIEVIVTAKRKGKKKEELAEQIANKEYNKYVDYFLECANKIYEKNIQIC